MTEVKSMKCKNRISQWMLALTLLLGIFTFSGYIGHSSVSHQPVKTTELVVTKGKSVKQTVFFCNTLNTISENPFSGWSKKYEVYLLIAYRHNIETSLNDLLKQLSGLERTDQFFQNKTIPQYSDEYSFPIHRG
jgi:hypothetical protein